MKRIVLFGAGKSSTSLIDYLLSECAQHDWRLTVADGHAESILTKIGDSSFAEGLVMNIENAELRKQVIHESDLVISLLPPAFHHLVARDALQFNKNLLTASYIDEIIRQMAGEIEKKKLFFLCEMGLDPGIDHMSAMQLVHRIHQGGGKILSFRSHTGGLVAPESDDNPWHYKISWNPRNVVLAGSSGAIYKENGQIISMNYNEVFADCGQIEVAGLGKLAFYPNRDSLPYIPLYSLEESSTFIRTTLRYPAFCENWKHLVNAGLTNDQGLLPVGIETIKQWSSPMLPFITEQNMNYFSFLGLFDDLPIPKTAKTSADVLQGLLESRLKMLELDKDMIVMLHEIEYQEGADVHSLESSLVIKGQNIRHTAMAKTVGLPLGIAAKLILEGKLSLSGLHIPVLPQIYEPVLRELESLGFRFHETLN